ncbi:acyl carrier protein [Candidatus Pelagibacter sp.]|nr:acyl carrier protein [Candidatus Pelagibacter sp.]
MSYIIEKSINKIMSQILKVDIKLINQQSSASDFDNWDSMSNVRLILAIEKKFDIKIQISETTSIDNVGDLIRLVLSKTN